MANIKHAVVGTDMLVGSSNAAYLKSVVFTRMATLPPLIMATLL